MAEIVQRFVLSIGQNDVLFDDNSTLCIDGAHSISVPLVPANNKTIGKRKKFGMSESVIWEFGGKASCQTASNFLNDSLR